MSSKRARAPPAKKSNDDSLPYFVPDEGIDVEPLALYTRVLMDSSVEIKTGTNPHNKEQRGYWISSSKALTKEDIRAMMEDTLNYKDERDEGVASTYAESNTWSRRRRFGRAEQNVEGNRKLQPVRPTDISQSQRGSSDSIQAAQRHISPVNRSTYGQTFQQSDSRQPQQGNFSQQQYGSAVTRGLVYVESQNTYDDRQQSRSQEYSDNPYEVSPPSYVEGKPNPPSTTGSAGFSVYKTAGPGRGRHGE